ncbi:MAG: peptidoglycan editing factor PgeF [Mariprofundaceae bacterium]|nr:peptidoglycan editing factor PgeF [Mariprofundaceae bacterium]
MFNRSPLMEKHGVKVVLSDRDGGCSLPPFDTLNLGIALGDTDENVLENMQRLCQSSGLTLPHQAQQVHGISLLHCFGRGEQHETDADILLATEKHVPLAIRTADCLPILLADPEAQVIAAVHAGWRGTVAEIAKVAVSAMLEKGAKAERIMASLGACIGMCCFEVSLDIQQRLLAVAHAEAVRQRDGKAYADLGLANQYQLLASGLLPQHIEATPHCTACQQKPAYFSYRRDAGQTGRQLSIIVLE